MVSSPDLLVIVARKFGHSARQSPKKGGKKERERTEQKRLDERPENSKAIEIMDSDLPCCGSKFFLYVMIIAGLVTFAGLMAGLTLGLMSLGLVDLEVLMKSGRPQDKKHAG